MTRQRLDNSRDVSPSDAKLFDLNIENVLESITDAFFALDREWRFTYLNRQAGTLLQRNRNELPGKNIWEEFPEAVGTMFFKQYQKALAEQTPVVFEEYYPPLESWFEVRAYPSAQGLLVYFLNINERRKTEENLKYQKTLLEALTESVLDGILIVSTEGKMAHFNRQFVEIWNFPPEIVNRNRMKPRSVGRRSKPPTRKIFWRVSGTFMDSRIWKCARN